MTSKPPPEQDVARAWKRTRRGAKISLNDYRLLGEACNRLLDHANHGQKRTRTAKAIKLIQQGEPLSWSYVHGILYKSRRFALACRDLGMLAQLQHANLSWRQVTELLPLIRPERRPQATVDFKARTEGIVKLRQLLKQAASKRNPLTAAEVVQQMKLWSRQHSSHLGEAKAAYRDRVSIRKLLRAGIVPDGLEAVAPVGGALGLAAAGRSIQRLSGAGPRCTAQASAADQAESVEG